MQQDDEVKGKKKLEEHNKSNPDGYERDELLLYKFIDLCP